MKRIYVPNAQLGSCLLQGSAYHYLANVLRCRLGENVEVFDGGGKSFLAQLEELTSNKIRLTLSEEHVGAPPPPILLLQTLLRQPSRFEWVLQKATELGVAEFWPLLSERSLQTLPASSQRQARWQKIMEEAARQSERNLLPKLQPCLPLDEALRQQPKDCHLLLLNESETQCLLREVLREILASGKPLGKLAVLVGPEGGWTPDEVASAKQQGAVSVGLGPCILKAETTGLAVLSILQFVAGQLG
ncbi:MAG: 16S rRNA (uracil(1498)-N(3))-methyltransferase [Proteobacteria bacterium]|nr:16S rRNA (uracil(1498)-N(3))-methyltransferase [Cystobacterineae bacterium]MCL2259514.1 16S rRNA (uracil(1498)-N(3))-methyltransferase [Cystobacterineae bacterium]MCL2314017.1 16S rRNA (uracil(1498)-N(3))-methyltransferase [Pseudomonadota bacterium]